MVNPRLIAISGPLKGLVALITAIELTIGRAADNGLVLDDDLVSRYHFAVCLKDGAPYLRDCATRNGTFVNGEACLEKFLVQGDRIKCGSTTFLYLELADSEEDLPTIVDDETDRNRRLETLRADYSVRDEAAVHYRGVAQAFAKMAAALNEISDIHELKVLLLEAAFEIIPARRAAILLNGSRAGTEPKDFESQIYRERDFDGEARFPLSGTVLADVYAARSGQITNNITPVVCVPLIVAGMVRGFLYMEGTESRSGFEPEHLFYLQGIADYVVAAVRLSQEFESVRVERDVFKAKAKTKTEAAIIGKSSAMKAVDDLLRIAAGSDLPVLIFGETGTGKELAARRIHEMSRRSKSPLVDVNCAAVVESLFESEFLGHSKGAYSGAIEARDGKFKQADGGTLLLDEVGELRLPMQPKLLRVLQEQKFEPVGGNRSIKVDVRVIAATNVDLETAVTNGTFRQDLFFRLNAITIQLPPLRERREDIPLLAVHFAGEMGISEPALKILTAYDWPGNVRELENVVRAAAVMAQAAPAEEIRPKDLPGRLMKSKVEASTDPGLQKKAAKSVSVADVLRMMAETGNNVQEAAIRLGISEGYVYKILRTSKNNS